MGSSPIGATTLTISSNTMSDLFTFAPPPIAGVLPEEEGNTTATTLTTEVDLIPFLNKVCGWWIRVKNLRYSTPNWFTADALRDIECRLNNLMDTLMEVSICVTNKPMSPISLKGELCETLTAADIIEEMIKGIKEEFKKIPASEEYLPMKNAFKELVIMLYRKKVDIIRFNKTNSE